MTNRYTYKCIVSSILLGRCESNRMATADLENMGESTDGMCDSASKLRDKIKALSGVDIMLDEETFKSTYQIMQEISSVFDSMTDVNQASLLELIAGKNRANNVAALLTKMSTAAKVYETSINSAGSASEEFEKQQDSITFKLNQLKATAQEIGVNFISSDLIKDVVDFGTGILTLTNKLGGLETILAIATVSAIGFKLSLKECGQESLVTMVKTQGLQASVSQLSAAFKSVITSAGSTKLLGVGGLILGATVVIKELIDYVQEAEERAIEASDKAKKAYEEQVAVVEDLNTQLKDIQSRIRELKGLGALTVAEEEELKKAERLEATLQRQLVIEEKLANIKKQDASDKAENVLKEGSYSINVKDGSGFWGTESYNAIDTVTKGIESIKTMKSEMEDLYTELNTIEKKYKDLGEEDGYKNDEAWIEASQAVEDYEFSIEQLDATIAKAMQDIQVQEKQLAEDSPMKKVVDGINEAYDEYIKNALTAEEVQRNINARLQQMSNSANIDLTTRTNIGDTQTVTNDKGSTFIVTPVLPDGTVLDDNSFNEYVNNIASGKEINADIIVASFNGEDSAEQAKQYANSLDILQKAFSKCSDKSSELMSSISGMSAEELSGIDITKSYEDESTQAFVELCKTLDISEEKVRYLINTLIELGVITGEPLTIDVQVKENGLSDISSILIKNSEGLDTFKSEITKVNNALNDMANLTDADIVDIMTEFADTIDWSGYVNGVEDFSTCLEKLYNQIIADGKEEMQGAEKIMDMYANSLDGTKQATDATLASLAELKELLLKVKSGAKLNLDEMSNLIVKYPSLADKVKVVNGMYTLETETIEELINSQKELSNTAIATETERLNNRIASTQEILNQFEREIEGIALLAEAYETLSNTKVASAEAREKARKELYGDNSLKDLSLNDTQFGLSNETLATAEQVKADTENAKRYSDAKKILNESQNRLRELLQVSIKETSSSSSSSKSKSNSTSEYKGEIDWIEQAIKVAESAVTSLENELSNTEGFDAQISKMGELGDALLTLYDIYDKNVIPERESRWKKASTGLSKDVLDAIQKGTDFSVDTFYNSAVKSGETSSEEEYVNKVNEAIDAWNELQDAKTEKIEIGVKISDNAKKQVETEIEKLQTQLSTNESTLDNTYNLEETISLLKEQSKLMDEIYDKQMSITSDAVAQAELTAKHEKEKSDNKDAQIQAYLDQRKAELEVNELAVESAKSYSYQNSLLEKQKDIYRKIYLNELALAKTNEERAKITKEYNANIASVEDSQYANKIAMQDQNISLIDNKKSDILNAIAEIESAGNRATVNQYTQLMAYNKKQIGYYENEIALAKQKIETEGLKYGMSEYEELQSYIQECENSISGLNQEQIEYNENIRKMQYYKYEDLLQSLESTENSLRTTLSLLDGMDSYDDKGNATSAGNAKMDLYSQGYELATQKAKAYSEEIQQLELDYKNGRISQQNYNDELATLTSNYNSAISSVNSYRQSMIDLAVEGINAATEAYKEEVSAVKKALQAQKELDDYNSSLEEKTKQLATLQKQINALSLSDSREDRAKLLELKEQYAELEKEIDEMVADNAYDVTVDGLDAEQEAFEEAQEEKISSLKNNLSEQESLVKSYTSTVKSTSDETYQYLTSVAESYGTTLASSLTTPWDNGISAMQAYKNYYDSFISGITTNTSTSNASTGTTASEIATGTNSDKASTISSVLVPYSGKQSADTAVNQLVIANGYKKLTWSEMAKLANDIGLSDITADMVKNSGIARGRIYQELMRQTGGKFAKGGIAKLANDVGEDGIAFVKNGEALLTKAQTANIQELIGKVDSLNSFADSLRYISKSVDNKTTYMNSGSKEVQIGNLLTVQGNISDEATLNKVQQMLQTDVIKIINKHLSK